MAPVTLWPMADLEEMRDRADQFGPETLSTAECLALAIRPGARQAAPGWAERLLARFGSLPDLLGADPADLKRESNVSIARDIAVVQDLHRRSLRAALAVRPVLHGHAMVCDYLRVVLAAERREQFRVLFLDKGLRLLADESLGRGSVDHVAVYPREVFRRALELHAAGLVIAHNHPAGGGHPSSADLDMTRQLVAAGAALRIPVHDHFLVAGDRVISFRTAGWM